MRKGVLVVLSIIFAASTAKAEDYSFIQQKRDLAEKQRLMMFEEIQHTRANPGTFKTNSNTPPSKEPQSVSFKVSPNGHYYIDALISGRGINFIADTGASSIFLSQDDAKRIGINVQDLKYSKVYNTANGQVKAAETVVPTFKVGPISMANVPVTVSPVSGGQSLLGMSFFSRLKKYNVENNTLTLYK